MKQIIVVRKDLKMRRGKEIAQACHASNKVLLENIDDPRMKKWLSMAFAKVCVRVDSLEELLELHTEALSQNVMAALITDAGKTEFNGVPTVTCMALGPEESDVIDKITGNLKLY